MKIQKIKTLLLCFVIVTIYSCKDNLQTKKEEITIDQQQESIDFDKILKCTSYTYDEDYFFTPDNGCLYNPKGENIFGNVSIYLISKEGLQIGDEEIDVQTEKINNLNIEDLKEDFDIFIYLIPKEFLNYNPNGDPIYYQKENYKEKLYTFDNKTKNWLLLDSLKIDNNSESRFEQNWRDNFINSKSNKVKKNVDLSKVDDISTFVKSIEAKNFSLAKQQTSDLNVDGNKDEILIFENNADFNSDDDKTKIAPIVVFINDGNNSYFKYENSSIYPNDFNDFFRKLVVKDNYFTIELANESPDEFTSSKYITFKYDKNNKNIVLHKYSEVINWNNDKPTNLNYSEKDFGTVLFQNFNSDIIKKLSKK
ncbi:hypothetical protein [Flavobacterium sp. JAS]|uniref:hypothetical protein n=1 Tax=Flavobacterium sp. JAS TaxID=2897329 RepID=UPI001E50942E|nr:hypothetical protein [Flavobacterium sp. JAS]MCD0469055.1 hypothetical protein [Flavobacterium sp. JAS]